MDILLELCYVRQYSETLLLPPKGVVRRAKNWADSDIQASVRRLETIATHCMHSLKRHYTPMDFWTQPKASILSSQFHVEFYGRLIMPKKRTQVQDFKRTEWKGFLEFHLSDAHLLAADEWEASDTDLLEWYCEMTVQGYKITGSHKSEAGYSTATMMAGEVHGDLSGWALSAKGRDGREALKLLAYKHSYALETDWTQLLGVSKPISRG